MYTYIPQNTRYTCLKTNFPTRVKWPLFSTSDSAIDSVISITEFSEHENLLWQLLIHLEIFLFVLWTWTKTTGKNRVAVSQRNRSCDHQTRQKKTNSSIFQRKLLNPLWTFLRVGLMSVSVTMKAPLSRIGGTVHLPLLGVKMSSSASCPWNTAPTAHSARQRSQHQALSSLCKWYWAGYHQNPPLPLMGSIFT